MVVTVKLRSANRCSGMIGSSARFSTSTNATAATTASAMSPRIVAEPHAYCEPPQVPTSTIAVVATAMRAMPK
ncbi:hypothetical protein D3C74_347380 [compost metagenome]